MFRLRSVLSALLIVSSAIVVPFVLPNQSEAAGTVTKTLTVTDSNGIALAGAIVELGYDDVATSKSTWQEQITNAQGQVIFTTPNQLTFAQYYIEPALGDMVDAVSQLSTDLSSSTNDSIRLQRATITLDVQDPVNSAPWKPHYFMVQGITGTATLALLTRSGAFGYYLPLNQTAGTIPVGYVTGAILAPGPLYNGPSDQFMWRGCLGFSGVGTNKTPIFYTDTTCATPVPLSGSTFLLQSPSYNIVGHLVNPDGSTLVIPAGVVARMNFGPSSNLSLTQDQILQFGLRGNALVKSDGTLYARLLGNIPGQYQITVSFFGSQDLPATTVIPIWKDAAGNLSTSQSGPFVAASNFSPLNLNITISTTTQNFKFNPISTVTGLTVPGYYNLSYAGTNQYISTGFSLGNLALGENAYLLDYVPDDAAYASEQFRIQVSAGQITVTNTRNGYSASNQAIFTLPIEAPNFVFTSVAPNEVHPESIWNWTGSISDICHLTGPTSTDYCFRSPYTSSQFLEAFHLTDGNYRMFLKPTNAPVDAETQFLINVIAGQASVTSDTGTAVNPISPLGVYALPTSVPNFHAQIINSLNPAVLPAGVHVQICPTYGTNSGGVWPCYLFLPNANNEGSAYLIDGDYVATVFSTGGAPNTFHVHVANGVSSVIEAVGQSGVNYLLPAGIPNITLNLVDSLGVAIGNIAPAGFQIQIVMQDPISGNWNWAPQSGSFVTNGAFSTLITTPGTYAMRINPQGLPQYGFTGGPIFTVTNNNGTPTINWPGQAPTTALTTNFTVGNANLKFNVINPLATGGLPNGWIGVQKVNPSGGSTWLGNIDINPQWPSAVGASLPDGNYLFSLNPPWGQPIAGLTSNNYFANVTGATTTLYLGNSATGTPLIASNGIYTLAASIANVTGTFVDSTLSPLGSALVNGKQAWSNACLQQLMPDGVNWNYITCLGVLSNGAFNLSVNTPGTYRVQLQPFGRQTVALTNTSQFDVTAAQLAANTPVMNFGTVIALTPAIVVKAIDVLTGLGVPNAQFEVRKGNQFIGWYGADSNGIATVSLTAVGAYTFIVHSNGNNSAYIQKSYNVTAVSNSGVITATADGLTAASGIYALSFGSQTLHGIVKDPNNNPVFQSQVVATDEATNQDLWNYQAVTGMDGSWSMYLPVGKYKIRAIVP